MTWSIVYTVRAIRTEAKPEQAWSCEEGALLYRGSDNAEAAEEAKRGFESTCDPYEEAEILLSFVNTDSANAYGKGV